MAISRRGLLTGLTALVAAPAIVRASSLMPVRLINEDLRLRFVLPSGHAYGISPGHALLDLARDMERMRQTIYSTFCIPSDVLAQLAMPESNSGKNKQLTAGLIK